MSGIAYIILVVKLDLKNTMLESSLCDESDA